MAKANTGSSGRLITSLMWEYFKYKVDADCSACNTERQVDDKRKPCREQLRGRNQSEKPSAGPSSYDELIQRENQVKYVASCHQRQAM
jgi:hypothetical protein